MFFLEIEKKESKTLNTYQKLLEKIRLNQSRQNQRSRGNIHEQTAHIFSSEENIFRSNKIKEPHEKMKLQNEEDMLRNT